MGAGKVCAMIIAYKALKDLRDHIVRPSRRAFAELGSEPNFDEDALVAEFYYMVMRHVSEMMSELENEAYGVRNFIENDFAVSGDINEINRYLRELELSIKQESRKI